MTLPNFPIRTRLIPYDDLGIQEVSPNLLSLQNDVNIVLAALMAMGQHGSQMLQADDKGNLRVGAGVTGDKYGDYKKTTILDTTTIVDNTRHTDIDISNYSAITLIFRAGNWGNTDNTCVARLEELDNHNNYFNPTSMFLSPNADSGTILISQTDGTTFFSQQIRIAYEVTGTTPSVDLYVDAIYI